MGSEERETVTASPGGSGTAGVPDAAPPARLHLSDALHEVEAAEHEGRPPAVGTAGNVVTALVVLAIAVAALLGSLALGPGSPRDPDTGTWPLLVSGVLVVLAVALLAVARRTHDAERFSRAGGLVLAGLATMVVFVAVLEVVGFEIPAALLAFVWLRFLGHESWRTSVITSLGIVVAFYVVFVGLLSVPIPHMF
jgi:putative tricarboxylic transport membrane protein